MAVIDTQVVPMKDSDRQMIITLEARGAFGKLEDGFVYLFGVGGALPAWSLRVIADELDRRNAPWEAQIAKSLSESSGSNP